MARAVDVAEPLREAFRILLKQAEEQSDNPRKSLKGVHMSIRSRLGRALSTDSPLASLYRMPGPDGLRRVVTASEKAGVKRALIDACNRQLELYERFFAEEELSRESLHAMLAGYLPEARAAIYRTNCQAAFRARSNIAGHFAETGMYSMFAFPGTEPGRCSIAVARGCRGWRRLRQDCMYTAHGFMYMMELDPSTAGSANSLQTDLDGRPLHELEQAPLLEEFCSKPLPRFKRIDLPNACNYYLISEDVGVRSACDFVLGEVHANIEPRCRTSSVSAITLWAIMSTPAKFMFFDLFIHEDVWRGRVPTVGCFNTVPLGPVTDENITVREHDRIDLDLSVRHLQPKLSALETSAIKGYGKMVDNIVHRIGYSTSDFRGYRCELSYPLHGSQVLYTIDLGSAESEV